MPTMESWRNPTPTLAWSFPFDKALPCTGMFEALVGYSPRGFNAGGEASVVRISGAEISGDLLGLLGARPGMGRTFTSEEHTEGADVAIVSHALWTRLFDSDANALGSTIRLDGRPHAIVGVAPAGFGYPGASDVWVPLPGAALSSPEGQVWGIGRLRSGVTVPQADAAMSGISSSSGTGADAARVIRVTSLHESLISGKHQAAATALLLASGLVLLVACVNLAGLVLASMSARRQELALRAAIGAGRGRMIRLLMTESLVLSGAAGLLGALGAQWGVDLFVAVLGAPTGPAWMEFGVDGAVLLFAIGLSIATTVVFGLAPAIRASRVDIRGVLQEGAGQGAGGHGHGHRRTMAVAQIAVSLALVAAAASVVASSLGLERLPTGFDPEGLLGARVSLSGAEYATPAGRLAFIDRVDGRLRSLPGVTGVAAASHIPLMDRQIGSARFLVDPGLPVEGQPVASMRFIGADYLEAMRIPTVRGRSFTNAESRDVESATALVNATMARRYWADGDAVGRRIRLLGNENGDLDLTIVGIVGDVAQRQLPGVPENQVYLPLAHASELSFVLRTTGEPGLLAPHVRAAVSEADAAMPVTIRTMADAYAWYVWDRRGQGLVLAVLGGVALLLAALGIYGVMSLMVANRRREIGVRMALGSTRPAVRRLVVGASLRLTAVGVAAGLLLGMAATTGLASIFHGVRPFDVRVFLFAGGLLTAVAVLAAWWPARRAMAVDPISVLKK